MRCMSVWYRARWPVMAATRGRCGIPVLPRQLAIGLRLLPFPGLRWGSVWLAPDRIQIFKIADASQRPPLVLEPGGQRPGIQHRIQRRSCCSSTGTMQPGPWTPARPCRRPARPAATAAPTAH